MTARLPYKKIITLAATFVFLFSTLFVTVFAQDSTENGTTGPVGIQVSSPVYNFQIDPAGTAQEIIKIRNVGDSTQTFFPEVFNFRPAGETGTPEFILSDDAETYTYSLASWINISKESIKLDPNESAALNFTINVPSNAEPGGRYAGVLFGTSPPQTEGTQVAISNKVGSLIMVRVSGDTTEQADVEEFSTLAGNFYRNPPVDFLVRIKNTGNVHVIPQGNIEIKDLFGRTVANLPVNERNGNVLPESIRRFDKETDSLTWDPGGFNVGRYTATLSLTYGDPAKNLNSELTFWVVPWMTLLIILLTIIILILLLIYLIRRYNQWLINKAQSHQTGSGSDSPPTAG